MDIMSTLKDTQMKTMNLVHRTILGVTGGRVASRLGNMPVVKVTTTGRVSGRPRTVMLTTPIQEDGRYVLVASKGGDDRHPDWYRNMVANPEFQLEPVDGDAVTLVARTAGDEEKAELWPRIVTTYQGYGGYQDKTDRDIPVVIAEPA